jgi:isocitrate dehydrogenase kinase/phosphatase
MRPSGEQVAGIIVAGFIEYREQFSELTLRSKARFESAAWLAVQEAGARRLALYHTHARDVTARLRAQCGGIEIDGDTWHAAKIAFVELIRFQPDYELFETFFNSIHRELTDDADVNEYEMFVHSPFSIPPVQPDEPIFISYTPREDIAGAVKAMLQSFGFKLPWQNLARDVRNILRSIAEIHSHIRDLDGLRIELLKSVFYRNKAAHLIGRFVYRGQTWPLALPILVDVDGTIYVDTLICDTDELSVLFSFTRSYFMVDVPMPWVLIDYLQELLPSKKRWELYTSIGLHKHGKTEFYRGFVEHLQNSDDQFVIAPGIKGMVMAVFTLPSYQTVFKVIKDEFPPQKDITREMVKEKYYIVKTHDRVGRMADTQEFSNMSFPLERFSSDLIDELLAVARSSITITGDRIIIKHLYTERLMTPLNMYLETATDEQLTEVLDEYGNAIKQLAAANIFPGDMLLKNFGVTRHGRVVFYDYDEICYLTDVNFRKVPEPRTPEEEMSAEPFYSVGPNDVFPEEFKRFLFGRPGIKKLFTDMHGELFDPDYWKGLQAAIGEGQIMDVFPYRRKKRFGRRRMHEGAADDAAASQDPGVKTGQAGS